MTRVTQTYKRSFSGSIGAGWGAVFGSSGKQYYLLEHKIGSKYHRAGETQEIIVDEIEIGRGAGCQVRFDESFTTVSRRHAAIVREGDKWKLIRLSNINPTFLNNHPVPREWYLQNGDEIQLAIGGPKLGFIIPAGKTTGSIGLTRRMGLFAHQALRPYKWAIALLATLLVLATGGLSTWKYRSDKEAQAKIAALGEASKARYDQFQAEQDSLAFALQHTENDLLQEKARNQKLRNDFEQRFQPAPAAPPEEASERTSPPSEEAADPRPLLTGNQAIDACLPQVYYFYSSTIEVIYPDGERRYGPEEMRWQGTGFLLDDGRFVTARHMIEPWFFVQGEEERDAITMNLIAHNGGKIVVHLQAVSSTGNHLSFTNEHFVCNRSHDRSGISDDGLRYAFAKTDDTDWAYSKTSRTGGLAVDPATSVRLERGTELTVLGFPFGLGANSINDIQPVWSTAITAMQGLNRGVILTTNANYEHGNSGGPVFYTDSDGRLRVIGIVSAGAGRSTGFVVPIASIY
jgi:S1-C subfamily serine protease